MNIIASTTQQWNPGDNFILQGIKNIHPPANWVIYNRNPDNKNIVGNQFTNQSMKHFHKVIIAGSPQWYGKSVEPLLVKVIENQIPLYYVGIGIGEQGLHSLSEIDKEALKQAKKIITRGPECARLLNEQNIKAETKVCPAFFASPKTSPVNRIKPVGCVLDTTNKTPEFIEQQVNLYKKLNVDIIVHHVDELSFACDNFDKVHYSYDPRDYKKIYEQFSIIVSARLHGAIYAASQNIPAICININSIRCQDAVKPFENHILLHHAEDVENILKNLNYTQFTSKLKEFYSIQKNSYIECFIT